MGIMCIFGYYYRMDMYLYVHYCGVVSMIWENYTLMFCVSTCGVLIHFMEFCTFRHFNYWRRPVIRVMDGMLMTRVFEIFISGNAGRYSTSHRLIPE